ncbi:hypothetical protein BH23GEM5_BH23GEM5_28900 [soil metagenome]
MSSIAPDASVTGSGARHRAGHGEKALILILISFLLIFPKGGIKLAGVPITWGYLALILPALTFLLGLAAGRGGEFGRIRLVPLALLLPFQGVVVLALLLNGSATVGFSISLVVTFFFLPLVFLLVLGLYLDRTDLAFVLRMVRIGIFSVAVYGIFLFVFKLQTGRFIEIPFLTVNAGDVGGLEDKYIDRGGVFKLISTYNNGNIYGVSLLILLPLYAWLERSVAKLSIVKLSLLLTLSRTVWAGLIVYEVLQRLYVRRITLRAVFVLLTSLVILAVGVWYALVLIGVNVGFLFDRNLGGRLAQWYYLETATVLPTLPFGGIGEIVYLSVLHNFGLLGLACFLVGMSTPLLLHFSGCVPLASSTYKRSLVAGLMVYLIVAGSDGAILYIPVMAIFWFVVSLLLSGNAPGLDAPPGSDLPASQERPPVAVLT